ncbi:MAG: hypothetical protein ABI760_16605, partial [Ferruginibacter sp.]
MKNSRRRFFKKASTGILTFGLASVSVPDGLLALSRKVTDIKEDRFKVGIAYWTFVKFKLEPALEMTQR